MAHNIRPHHRPHEQLRTEAPKQRKHTDKYVSAFVSSKSTVDMSFSNPLLQESADHYSVGIDDLTLNLSHLSLLEFETGDVLFQIKPIGYMGDIDQPQSRLKSAGDHAVGGEFVDDVLLSPEETRALSFAIDRPYSSIADILHRAQQIARTVKHLRLTNPDNYDIADPDSYKSWNRDTTVQDDLEPEVSIDMTAGGLLRFKGNQNFWVNFLIHIPNPKYQILLLGKEQEYIAIDAQAGTEYAPYDADGYVVRQTRLGDDVWGSANDTKRAFVGGACIPKTLDRRVAIEVGCSLPVKNSPMLDHGVESPDFVIGRYFYTPEFSAYAPRESAAISLNVHDLGPQQVQGPKDRVCYHHLGPQQKIQALRLRLWARVRTYNADTRTWGMKTIQMPVEGSDFWHVKLHFRHKAARY